MHSSMDLDCVGHAYDDAVQGRLLAGVLGGVFGAVLLTAIVAILLARWQCKRSRVGLADPDVVDATV